MGKQRVVATLVTIAIAATFIVSTAGPSDAALTPTLAAYATTLSDHALPQTDGTTYVTTGDIHAEWLRDASAIARPYIPAAKNDSEMAQVLRGIAAREAKCILVDSYANAFEASYQVFERKFELDSLLYPIWFAYAYWQHTGDATIFTGEENAAFARIIDVMRREQHHNTRSNYRHSELQDGGQGSPVSYTGMIWTGFRPSDDAALYHFNIPDNMLAVVALHDLSKIETSVYHNDARAHEAEKLAAEIQNGIREFGIVNVKGVGKMYAYEVDGRGHVALMDDANVPSLLSIPYMGYLPAGDPTYQNTRRFILSDRNPYYFTGRYASGIGSPHTPHGYVWPLALVMQALTSTDSVEIDRVMGYIAASTAGADRLHESFDPNDPSDFTRADFAWPNALYAELIANESGLHAPSTPERSGAPRNQAIDLQGSKPRMSTNSDTL